MLPKISTLAEAASERRRLAVQLRLQGLTLAQVRERTGLSSPTIVAAFRAFQQGGWNAVAARPAGRPAGFGRRLDSEQEMQLAAIVWREWPEDHGLPAEAWTPALVQRLAEQRFGMQISRQALARYLKRWGCVANAVPRASAAAHRLAWCGEVAGGPSTQCRGRALFLVTARGRLHWLPVRSGENARALHALLRRGWSRGTTLLLHGMRVEQAVEADKGLAAWLAACPGLAVEPTDMQWIHPVGPAAPLRHRETRAATPVPKPQEEISMNLTHLQRLEAESIHIMREVVAESDNPVMLYSIGKDSAVMLHLARKAFFPAVPPFPLLHVDTTWKFRDMYAMRERMARESGMELLVHVNEEGVARGINPFTHGSQIHTDVMKTQALKQALDKHGFDVAFGGARRDEEKSRAKERIFSFRTAQHRWDPKSQRPELWRLYNARKHKGESIRVFPLSNWTELDIWQYILLENIPIVPLYFAKERPVVERDGTLIMVDDERMPLRPGEVPVMRRVRFRTLGCYPLSGAVESEAQSLTAVIQEMLLTRTSERQGRMIDHDSAASMEKKKQEGYF